MGVYGEKVGGAGGLVSSVVLHVGSIENSCAWRTLQVGFCEFVTRKHVYGDVACAVRTWCLEYVVKYRYAWRTLQVRLCEFITWGCWYGVVLRGLCARGVLELLQSLRAHGARYGWCFVSKGERDGDKQKVRFELLSVALGPDVRDHLTATKFPSSLKSVWTKRYR